MRSLLFAYNENPKDAINGLLRDNDTMPLAAGGLPAVAAKTVIQPNMRINNRRTLDG
jgi:hypothetical protein